MLELHVGNFISYGYLEVVACLPAILQIDLAIHFLVHQLVASVH